MPSERKYLVTGGTGFLGSALVKAMVDRGDDVVYRGYVLCAANGR